MLSKILERQIKDNNIFHSYIFEGDQAAAVNQYKAFAKALYKTDIDVDNLVEVIEPENNNISIDKIRQLNRDVYKKPAYFSHTIYVIKSAHDMRAEAQNAMLKTLEELPSYSIVIMLIDNRHKLLDTINSRSQIISLSSDYILDLDSKLSQDIIYLLKQALEKKYYIISKEKNLLKDLSEDKEESLRILTKIFTDAKLTDYRDIEDYNYKNLLESLSDFTIKEIEDILLKLENTKSLLAIRINFQMAMEDLIFSLIEYKKKSDKRRAG